MNSTFSSIDEYITACSEIHRPLLQAIRATIIAVAPDKISETISYKMPTFRYKGNLIHFALNKKHIGLYPGSAAIEYLASELTNYKTSKGCIQLSLTQPAPVQLIQNLVFYNMNRLKEKQQPNWHSHN